jgi:Sec7-like guanine-nucleotide exchange factor
MNRRLLAKVHLPKESQQIDRALEAFAKHYHDCNPDLADSYGMVLQLQAD